jgi:hypothetical protein
MTENYFFVKLSLSEILILKKNIPGVNPRTGNKIMLDV